jgi:putative ABC transport system permease protein
MNEIRHALRRLRATPVVTLSAIACLSIGIWMTCVVTAVGRGFFRPDLGVPAADQLVQLDEKGLFINRATGRPEFGGSILSRTVMDSLASRKVFAAIGYYSLGGAVIVSPTDTRSMLMLSSGMMDVLGVNVALGRRFIPANDSSLAIIISYGLWRSMFGGDPQVIGRRIRLWSNHYPPVPIVGVMREGFVFPRDGLRYDAYISAGLGAARLGGGSGRSVGYGADMPESPARAVLARLRHGTDVDDLRPIVQDLASRHVASDREALRVWSRRNTITRALELASSPVSVEIKRYYHEPKDQVEINFVLLVIACGFAVVLIAAANVVNLLLVRGAARRQEIAVRLALGAARAQIIRGLVVETALLSIIGIAIGFLVAFWQWQLLETEFIGRDLFGSVDVSMLPVAIGAGLTLTVIVGVWPGVRATSLNLEQVLRDTKRAGVGTSPLDGVLGRLVGASTAATVMLLVCAVLLALSARDWMKQNVPSERTAFVSMLTVDEQLGRAQRAELARTALNRVRATAGVQFATLGSTPGSESSQTLMATADGGAPHRLRVASVYDVSDAYFDAMHVRILQGRKFLPFETRDSTASVIISRSTASNLFGAGAVLGRRFQFWSEADSVLNDASVVGVVEDLTGVGQGRFQIYRAFGTVAPARTPVLATPRFRETVEPAALSKALRAVPGLLSSDVSPLGGRSNEGPTALRYMLMGFTMFAVVGLVLAAIGTYGIVAYSVVRRTHEIGVRIALGAQQQTVTWMIVEQGLKITVGGIIFGLLLSYWSTRVMGSILRDVKADYSVAMAVVVAFVLVISLVACWIPGYRAGRLNPVDALRAE